MSDLREAAQQALEALENASDIMDSWAQKRQDDAITALLAALAEPVQEPVAKVELMTTGGNVGLATRIVEIDDHLRERLRPGQLLYTAPIQRKPLTEVELEKATREVWRSLPSDFDHTTSSWVEIGIRYAERAHGIGGNDE